MGWRFRQSFKVIPGLRLNLSASGLSASIGGAPFTVNLGPRGLTGTASIPGSGVSFRQHLAFGPQHHGSPSVPLPHGVPRLPMPPAQPTQFGGPIEEVRSASTELLTSESLRELKRLIEMTRTEHEDISHQLSGAQYDKKNAVQEFQSWDSGFLFKRMFKKKFARRRERADTATAKVAELEEQLRLTKVVANIEIDREQAEPFFRMRDDFAALSECAAIWDVKTHQATDRFHERTTASVKIERQKVALSLGTCDLITWDHSVPHLLNSKGGELFLFPGFILYRTARRAFSAIAYSDVRLTRNDVRFQEDERVPRDSKIIGQTWAKANKDGSPDRRFANNHQIPIALYAALTLRSESGLWEEFQFSDPARVERFVESFLRFAKSFA